MADRPILLRRGTTAEVTALTLLDGEPAWDSTANNLYIGTGAGNIKIGGATGIDSIDDIGDVTITALADNELLQYDSASGKWINRTETELALDHGLLSGLADNDHTQYTLKATLAAKGSIYGASAASTPAELAVGTNGYVLTAASAQATGLAWGSANDVIKRIVEWQILAPDTALAAGNDVGRMFIPSDLNAWNLTDIDACVNTASTSGLPSIQLHNLTDTVDMLTVNVTIDENEKTSYTAATQPTIDTTHDDVATGDELRCDVDADGTSTTGLTLVLVFTKP